MANTHLFITDTEGRELPLGVRGELCIAGSGVALGYHNRPELTMDRFGSHLKLGLFYRTGDLACWRPDGTVALHGRIDRQVKLRGNRIELGEVEAVLLEHEDVHGAAVVVDDEAAAGPLLIAFVQTAADPDTLAGRLWEHARTTLPASSVPQEFIVVDSFPSTVSHKTDYLALERLARQHRTRRAEAAGADPCGGDALVAQLVALWRELLQRADIDAHANFFAHGGHSLLGAQLVQRVEDSLATPLAMTDLYADPTPARLAARVRRARGEEPTP